MTIRKRTLETEQVQLTHVENGSFIWGDAYDVSAKDTDANWRRYDTALLGYNSEGIIELTTESKSLVISPGMITYIPANLVHQQKVMLDKLTGWFVSIPVEYTSHLPDQICTFHGSTLLTALIQKITALKPGTTKNEQEQRLVETFIEEFKAAKTSTPLYLPMPMIPSLRDIAEKIISAPSDMNGLDHWAKEAAMSRRSFTRHFNKETGLSFVLWRQLAKVYAAVYQLSQGKTVKEVSANLGYKDSSTFIALFRKTFGTSPKKYFYSGQAKESLSSLSEKIADSKILSKKKTLLMAGFFYEIFDWMAPQIQKLGGDQFTDLLTSISFIA